MLKRLMDVILSFVGIMVLMIPMLFIACLIRLTSNGPVLHWSRRMGKNNTPFMMPKFRSMTKDTPTVASHLLSNPHHHVTGFGKMLRKTSLDELPQLFTVLIGKMSLVGPRPLILAEKDMIDARTVQGVYALLPGITGWAQINGRDHLTLDEKVKFEAEYLQKQSFGFDLKILLITFFRVIRAHGITH